MRLEHTMVKGVTGKTSSSRARKFDTQRRHHSAKPSLQHFNFLTGDGCESHHATDATGKLPLTSTRSDSPRSIIRNVYPSIIQNISELAEIQNPCATVIHKNSFFLTAPFYRYSDSDISKGLKFGAVPHIDS